MQISQGMVSNAHVHQLTVSLNTIKTVYAQNSAALNYKHREALSKIETIFYCL